MEQHEETFGRDAGTLTSRFERAWHVTTHNLGPSLIGRMELGLTAGQLLMLYFVRQQERCTVSQLADKMEVNPSAITVMLDRLEHHQLVSRARDESDRRVVIVSLTERGSEELTRVWELRKRVLQHCLMQLNADELPSFVHTLERLASISSAMNVLEVAGLEHKDKNPDDESNL